MSPQKYGSTHCKRSVKIQQVMFDWICSSAFRYDLKVLCISLIPFFFFFFFLSSRSAGIELTGSPSALSGPQSVGFSSTEREGYREADVWRGL